MSSHRSRKYCYLVNPDWTPAETKVYKSKVRKRSSWQRKKKSFWEKIRLANIEIDNLEGEIWDLEDWITQKPSTEETEIMVYSSGDEEEALEILMTMQERMGDDIGLVKFTKIKPKVDLKCYENSTEACGPSQIPMNGPAPLDTSSIEMTHTPAGNVVFK